MPASHGDDPGPGQFPERDDLAQRLAARVSSRMPVSKLRLLQALKLSLMTESPQRKACSGESWELLDHPDLEVDREAAARGAWLHPPACG